MHIFSFPLHLFQSECAERTVTGIKTKHVCRPKVVDDIMTYIFKLSHGIKFIFQKLFLFRITAFIFWFTMMPPTGQC